MRRGAGSALVLLLAGCYAPSAPEGLACSPMGECPDGQACEPNTRVCYAEGTTGVGTPTRLVLTTHASKVVARHPMGLVRAQIVDQRGQRVFTASAEVTVELLDQGDGLAPITGTTVRTAQMGEVIFDDLKVPATGTYRLRLVATGLPPITGAEIEAVAVDFEDPVSLPTGNPFPSHGAIADLNGDGHLDIIVGNEGGSTVSAFLTGGPTTVASAVDTEVGTTPNGLAVADFDGDGIADLAVASSPGGVPSLHVMKGKGDGTFVTYPSPTVTRLDENDSTLRMTTGDIDGDGRIDLVTSALAQKRTVWFNETTGPGNGLEPGFAFTRFNLVCNQVNDPMDVKLGDMNGDGKLDVVTTGHEGLCVVLRHPTSARQFLTPKQRPENWFHPSFTLADVDDDGDLDAVSYQQAMAFLVCKNDGAGALSAGVPLYETTLLAGAVDSGDFNDDGLDDLVLVDQQRNVKVFVQELDGLAEHRFILSSDTYGVLAGDITGDGILDVVVLDGGISYLVGR